MHVLQHLAELVHVESGTGRGGGAEALAGHLAAERGALQVQESRRTLQIRKRIWRGRQQAFELGPAGHLPAQHVHQRHVMPLQHAEQRRHVAGDIVDHLRPRPERPAQEHPAHADEGLDVAVVWHGFEAADDQRRQAPLAADIGCDRLGRCRG